jgi:hypothetical protein
MAKEPINRDLITRLLKEGATGKQRDIYDDQINGFGVLIMLARNRPVNWCLNRSGVRIFRPTALPSAC